MLCMKYTWNASRNILQQTVLKVLNQNTSCYSWEYKTVLRKLSSLSKTSVKIPDEVVDSCDIQNGMRIICDYKKSLVTTVGCFLPAGTMYEKPEERGSALFMEHLLFRRTTEKGPCEIEKELTEIGGNVSAIAMRDIFLFYGTAPSCNLDKLIQLFADIICKGVICEEDVVSEKCIIIQHLLNMDMDAEQVVMDYLQDVSYQDTELGKSVYPETEVIKSISADKVMSFRQRLFIPRFMTMISSGDICLQKLHKIVCKYFGPSFDDCKPLPGPCEPKIVDCTNFRFSGGDLRLRDDDEELGFVALGVEGPGYVNRQDHCLLTIAKEIVGSWEMSHGGANHNAPYLAHCAFNTDMCYLYKSFNLSWTTTSIWGCYFVCDKLKLDDMVYMLQKEWMRLCTAVTEKEVSRAINQCLANELMKLQDPVQRFLDLVISLSRGSCYEPYNERFAKYKKASASTIREAADRYIYDQCPSMVGLGRIENLSDYSNVRSRMTLLYR